MAFGWIAAATVAAGLLSADAAESAADTQASAARGATASQQHMFDVQNAQQEPYRQAGYRALNALDFGSGLGDPNAGGAPGTTYGSLTRPFTADDLKTNLAPNYEFMKQQGLMSTANLLNSQGGLGGNTLRGITDYAENYAGNAYQNAFSNYQTNQTNIFNRLSTIAGYGQTANTQGVQTTAALAPGISQSIQGAGAAEAAGRVGVANAIGSGLTNASSWYTLPSLLNYGKTGAGAAPG